MLCFSMICASAGSKSRLAKAAGAEVAAQSREEKLHAAKHIFKSKCTKHLRYGPLFEVWIWKNCTPLWREAHFQVKMYKTPQRRTAFWSLDLEKLHDAVARRTFASQNAKNVTCSGHFWTFRSPKMARRCGAKHIYKSKCRKHLRFAPLLEVPMSQGCNMD